MNEITPEILPEIDGFSGFRPIGRGASALVFRATQDQLERDVAIKVLRPGIADDRTRALFDVERKALGRLPKHQNIVTVFDSGFTSTGDPYLAMELCSSGSLAALVRANGPLSPELAVRCGLKVAGALMLAHRLGMIHRDVKPENVLISDQGEPVLSDFGIASLLETDSTHADGTWSPHHVAPELLRGAKPSESTDVYSLGSTIFTLLVGHYPHQSFPGERIGIDGTLSRVADPTWTRTIPKGVEVPREVEALLASLLVKDARRRLVPAEEVVAAFKRVERILGSDQRTLLLPTRPAETQARIPTATGAGATEYTVTEHTVTGYTVTEYDDTIVAKRPGAPMPPVSNDGNDSNDSSDGNDTGSRWESPLPRHGFVPTKRWIGGFALGAVATIAILVVAFTTSSTAPAKKPQSSAIPGNVRPEKVLSLSAPNNITIKPLGNEAEVSWTPDADPGVQYQVEILHDGDIVDTMSAAQPPVRIKQIDLTQWIPCVRINAIDPTSSRYAPSEPVCMNRVTP
jgi:serine/threonine protein kinase